MELLGTIEAAKAKVLDDARRCMERIKDISTVTFDTPEAAVRVLQRVRAETYEDLNQIQHEHLIVCAAQWLSSTGVCEPNTPWYWNPRQTGDGEEPDLAGVANGATVVSAEITTSAKPVGVIDTRMRKTLAKLSGQSGRLFYFVQTQAMAARATTKIQKAEWNITVTQLP